MHCAMGKGWGLALRALGAPTALAPGTRCPSATSLEPCFQSSPPLQGYYCHDTCWAPVPTYPTPQGCAPTRVPLSWGSYSHRCPAPQGSHSLTVQFPHRGPCTSISVCLCCPAVCPCCLSCCSSVCTDPAHRCPYIPAVLTHVCAPMWLVSFCPCHLRMPCVRCQPPCQHLIHPSDARDLGTFTSLFSLLASCHRQHHPQQ